MRIVFLLIWAFLTFVQAASAQNKPYGVFDLRPECNGIPEWVKFSGLESYRSESDFALAAQCSRTHGVTWVLKFGFDNLGNIENSAREARARALTSGLLPYIVAVQFNEEWYGQAMSGRWGPPSFDLMDSVRAYGGEQQRILKSVFNLPVIYIDAFVNADKQYGLANYRPLPLHTDVLGIETYVPNGGQWETHVQPYVDYVLATTDLPIVAIGQTFKHPVAWGDGLSAGPSKRDGDKFKLLLANPRVIAAWLFTWRDRPNGIQGGLSMPDVVGWFR